MADNVVLKHNIPDFKKQLAAFGFDMEKKIFRAGVNAAGQIFKKRAIELAPVSNLRRKRHIAGTLKRNIILFRPKKQTPGTERQSVGVRSGIKPKKGAAQAHYFLPFYWRWVEEGHRIVKRGSRITGGRRTKALKRARFDASGGGRTKAVWYLKRAFQSVGGAALDAFNKRVQARIDKENAKR